MVAALTLKVVSSLTLVRTAAHSFAGITSPSTYSAPTTAQLGVRSRVQPGAAKLKGARPLASLAMFSDKVAMSDTTDVDLTTRIVNQSRIGEIALQGGI